MLRNKNSTQKITDMYIIQITCLIRRRRQVTLSCTNNVSPFRLRQVNNDTPPEFTVTVQPFNDRARQYVGPPFFGHKSPAARAKELFKPSTDSASPGVKIEKKMFRFGFKLFWGERHK